MGLGQLVGVIEQEVVADVVGGGAVFTFHIVWILSRRGEGESVFIKGVRPGVVRAEAEVAGQTAIEADLQSVVVGVKPGEVVGDIRKGRVAAYSRAAGIERVQFLTESPRK